MTTVRGGSRTTYLAGEIAQRDFWFPPMRLPIGFGTPTAFQLPVLTMITGYALWALALLLPTRQAEDLYAGWWQLVMISEPTFPGCLIKCRAVAMFRMKDEAGGDDKVLCVPASDPRRDHIRDLTDVRQWVLLEIEHFFEVYKDLEPGKSVEGATWTGVEEAEEEVRASFARAKERGHTGDHR